MVKSNLRKWIGILSLICVAVLLLCACRAPNETATPTQTTESVQSATPTPTQTPSSTPMPTPVQTTQVEAMPTPSPVQAKPEPTYSYNGQVVCTANEFVNIRSEATTDSEILGTLAANAVADVIVSTDDWVHITYDSITGYVSRDYTINSRKPSILVPTGDWAAILVSPKHYLPDGFEVALVDFENGQVDARILDIATAMFADAKQDDVDLQLVDAYRSYDTQSAQYEKKVSTYVAKGYSSEDAEVKAATITARPNTSEHQTGLALDIVTPSYTKRDSGFANTQAFKWLNANAHHYGFTMRYKQGKEDITGVVYESWHWRFVGTEAAAAMKQSGDCYEEYLNMLD